MFWRACRRACSRSPKWYASPPQQVCAAGIFTSQPLAASTRTVAMLVGPNMTSPTHPSTNATVARRAPRAGTKSGSTSLPKRSGTRAAAAMAAVRPRTRPNLTAARSSFSFCTMRRPRASHRSLAGLGNTPRMKKRLTRTSQKERFRPSSSWARASSMMTPYLTPDGQEDSQARQSRHRSRCSSTLGTGSSVPAARLRIRWRRPRGESSSMPSSP